MYKVINSETMKPVTRHDGTIIVFNFSDAHSYARTLQMATGARHHVERIR